MTRSAFSISSWDLASVGSSTIWNRSAGAPFAVSASLIRSTVLPVVFLARGAAETIPAFFPLITCMKLPSGVTVGFVAGVMQAITPIGCAISMMPSPGLSLIMPTEGLSFR